jgi:hypothetical protein
MFGREPQADDDIFFHLFAAKGQLQVIAVPFEEGEHVCTSTSQAVSLIQDLRSLHAKEHSHGDIRGYNCVFGDNRAHLIDFDFGGMAGSVEYPKGYITLLDDGERIPSTVFEEKRAIQKWHDVYALVDLLLVKHIVTGGTAESAKELIQLRDSNNCLLNETGCVDTVAATLLNSMEHFLKGMSIKPTTKLKMAVKLTGTAERKTLGGFGGTPEHRKKK